MQSRAATLLVASLFLGACSLDFGQSSTGDGPTGTGVDGAVCMKSDDCKSGNCLFNLCTGSTCACSGSECPTTGGSSSDCDAGWLCVHHPASTDFLGFSSPSVNLCEASCPHCPAHHSCFDGDSFCTADGSWTDPVVTATATPDHVAPGEAVSLQASAVSPIGDTDFDISWSFNDAESTSAPGATVTHTYAKSGVYHPDVSVDSGHGTRHGHGATVVVVCGTAGARCSTMDLDHDPLCCAGLTCVEMDSFDSFCQ